MKKYKLILMGVLISALSFTSCKSYFGDINVDPDNPTAVSANVLLPQIQMRLAYALWGDGSRYIGIYTAHLDGVGRQFAVIDNYGIQPGDLNNYWDNYYSGVMADNRQLQLIATAGGYNHYMGMALALEAYALITVAATWGDAPYSEALNGTDLLQPVFDGQQSLYTSAFSLINQAKDAFNLDDGGNAPGADDFIYGGDIPSWMGFLNMLEARANLHLAKRDAGAYQKALTALGTGLSADATVTFGTGATEAAPWYQYIEQRADISVGAQYLGIMDTSNDPRFPIFGADLQALPHPFWVANRSVPLLSMTEQHFLMAECFMNAGQSTPAHDAFKAGVQSSIMDDVGLSQADLDAYMVSADPGSANLTLTHIMTEKYVAMFCDPEVFSDWRRTGIPTIIPKQGAEVPRRLPYSQNEILANTNTPSPADVTIYTRTWWDQ